MSPLGVGALLGDRLLFAFTGALGLVSLLLLWGVPDAHHRRPVTRSRAILSRPSAGLAAKQAAAGALNAFGSSMVNALFVVWLNRRNHVGAEAIGPLFALTYLLMAGSYVLAAALAGRIGAVRTIAATRILAAALTVVMAMAPTFLLAALLHVARIVVMMMITPVRQSFTMSIFPAHERASAAGTTGLVRRLSAAGSPPVAGALLDMGLLDLPFFISALLQGVSGGLYYWFFHSIDQEPASVPPSVPALVPLLESLEVADDE